ncbi:hypothetical protein BGX31_010034 [Mortierella sp. GBA43]|nr:hypothetical protein BGX31_010034 [Mortierella sp. GBA43]
MFIFGPKLDAQQKLELAAIYLNDGRMHSNFAAHFCGKVESTLAQVKVAKEDAELHGMCAAVYGDLGKLQEELGLSSKAQASFKKQRDMIEKAHNLRLSHPPNHSHDNIINNNNNNSDGGDHDTTKIPLNIFVEDTRPPSIAFRPLKPDDPLLDTQQLVCYLALLQAEQDPNVEVLDEAAALWLQRIKTDPEESKRLKLLATDLVRAFKNDGFKSPQAVAEVVLLASVLEQQDYRCLVEEFCLGISQSVLLEVHQLEGLDQLLNCAKPGYLVEDDLIKIIELLSTRLRGTHQQSLGHLYRLTLAVAHVLDAMVNADVKDLDRETLHAPLAAYLNELKESLDPFLVFHAAYACQALLCVPDNETVWQAALRRTGKVIQGVAGLVSQAQTVDLIGLFESLKSIQQGLPGVSEVTRMGRSMYDACVSLAGNRRDFLDSLEDSLSFQRKRVWYSALRAADALIRDGRLTAFKKLVYEVSCRRDPAFQWGISQQLGEVASNSLWDKSVRQSAIFFLGEIYQNDGAFGYHANIKQWILHILMDLSRQPGSEVKKRMLKGNNLNFYLFFSCA